MRSIHLVPIVLLALTSRWLQSDEIVSYTKPLFRSVSFADDLHGWIAGYRGVFYTSDGGATWRRQAVTVGSLYGTTATSIVVGHGMIAWMDRNHAIIRSENGLVAGSANSTAWENLPLPAPIRDSMTIVSFTDSQNGVGLSPVGTLHQTTDGGLTWDSTYGRISNMPIGLFAISPTEIWLPGESATVLHTTNGGKSWIRQILPGPVSSFGALPDFRSILFIDRQEGWITGTGGLIYHTEDGGKRWIRQKTPFSNYTILVAISFVDRKEGWVVGSRYIKELPGPEANRFEAVILHTEDGGSTWVAQASNSKDLLLSVQALPDGRAWAVGQNGAVLRTTDHGTHWNLVKLE